MASTKSNHSSSRSHMVMMIDVDVMDRSASMGALGGLSERSISCGRLSMVDLAGSERIAKSEASGAALTEAKHINKSLSALVDVMSAISEREKKEKSAAQHNKGGSTTSSGSNSSTVSHIPFRNSKLTHLLSGSLKPGSKLVFITQVVFFSLLCDRT